ncbi:MAG: hypothetical protein HC828_03740 [Blastochloris sp.]|nr:hypothetical protein [Blastochloris sp.]
MEHPLRAADAGRSAGAGDAACGSTLQRRGLTQRGPGGEHQQHNPSFRHSVGCARQQGVQAGIHSYGRVGVSISIT